jgi:Ca2+/Na+ antiporter
MNDFLAGAVMMGAAAVAAYLLRSWLRTRDRLFMLFAAAFALLSLERWFFLLVGQHNELRSYVYLIRLAAFVLILLAIIDKNRGRRTKD